MAPRYSGHLEVKDPNVETLIAVQICVSNVCQLSKYVKKHNFCDSNGGKKFNIVHNITCATTGVVHQQNVCGTREHVLGILAAKDNNDLDEPYRDILNNVIIVIQQDLWSEASTVSITLPGVETLIEYWQ